MKSWGILVITAMGFIVGVVLAGVGGLSAKTSFFSGPRLIQQQKKIENYWTETGLGEKELFDLISNINCQSSEKYFIACVNSITQNLADEHKTISVETGEIESLNISNSAQDEMTEKQRLSKYMDMFTRQQASLIDFQKIWKQMLSDENLNSKAYLVANGINSFLSIYKDPHTYILPENYYEEVGSQLERSNLFVGLSFEKVKAKTIIRKVYKNSDAYLAGLEAFDEVLKINNQEVSNLNLLEISQILKDSKFKEFTFKISRNNDHKEIHFNRSYKNLSHVQFEVLMGLKNYAVVTLSKFNRGVCAEVARHVKSAIDKNISGLVLDLRDNPGGQLDEAACLAGLFLGMNKKTYTVEFFDPIKSSEVVLSSGSLLYNGPLVVLTNSSSASASELLAGALQDYKRALIVGEKTFGKGTFQESEVWSKNSKISLFKTQGFYMLPSQISPQMIGIKPDIDFDEKHLKIREENSYFNPIHNLKSDSFSFLDSDSSYSESLISCLDYSDVNIKNDLMLQKSLQILSCHKITLLLAQRYNPLEFN